MKFEGNENKMMSISQFMRIDQTWNGENYTARSFILYISHVMLRKLKEGNSVHGEVRNAYRITGQAMESRSIFGIFSCNKDQVLINLNAVFCYQPRCTHPRAPLHSGKFPFVRTFCLSY
jgi:hypothetical protein